MYQYLYKSTDKHSVHVLQYMTGPQYYTVSL